MDEERSPQQIALLLAIWAQKEEAEEDNSLPLNELIDKVALIAKQMSIPKYLH